jgi:hypothetical protein
MGHERVGFLPNTKKWLNIVDDIGKFSDSFNNVPQIANNTIKLVKTRFRNIENDDGVLASFKFLVLLSISAKHKNPAQYLSESGINLQNDFTLFNLSKEINNYISTHAEQNEFNILANQAVLDTVSSWTKDNSIQLTLDLFDGKNSFDAWQKASKGDGFCELARSFYAKFTERYLKYFLERETSSHIKNLADRENFDRELSNHVNEISKHAFETTKIMQSFAAGWFNKNSEKKINDDQIKKFVSFAFNKIVSELIRDEQ